MSYVILEVTIDHSRIVPMEPERRPAAGKGLLTFALNEESASKSRPIGLAKGRFVVPDDVNAPLPEAANLLVAFRRLQEELEMTPEKAASWQAAIQNARR
jgi:hypothetical protein